MAPFLTRRNQFQWVALLAVVVVLPTVSLLWFMSRVVANERLVARQKLAALYQDKLVETAAKVQATLSNRIATVARAGVSSNSYALFRQLVLSGGFEGLLIWNSSGSGVYPDSASAMSIPIAPDSALEEAWQLEFARQRYDAAAQVYDELASSPDLHTSVAAILGRSRCLSKLGRVDDAVQCCQRAAFGLADEPQDPALRLAIANARLMLLSLLNQTRPGAMKESLFQRTTQAIEESLYSPRENQPRFSSHENLFIARKLLEVLDATPGTASQARTAQLRKLAAAEGLSIAVAGISRQLNNQFDRFFPLELDQQRYYALRHQAPTVVLLLLVSSNGLASSLEAYRDAFNGQDVVCQVTDASGHLVLGPAEAEGEPIAAAALPGSFPGWEVKLSLAAGDVFEQAARRQIAVYVWTGVLVILLILVAAGVATQAVGRQIRLNRMKNDFIATVSHELKTPLASMRILVDTLLEGHVRDEAQARQYLLLTAKENERLSRMIESFLTFSRMERNKNAFTLARTSPAAIARDAAESVKTKYAARDCELTIEAAENLPDLSADHDAIVTVLVNLLDNACKYSAEDRRIKLEVAAEPGFIRFAVSDKGIGLARRHLRKIFESFYQVDNSLARRAEGCGLGLSIVKFIVHAHKGTIKVESRLGQGSTFTVRLPAARPGAD